MTSDAKGSNKSRALAEAIRRAADDLAGVDLAARCELLGLPAPIDGGTLGFRMLGRQVRLRTRGFEIFDIEGGTNKPVHPANRLLALRYLLCDVPLTCDEQWITYRQLPGGQFYYGPFRTRTVIPLVKAIGNDLDLLRCRLEQFDWRPLSTGDVGEAVHVMGDVEVALTYSAGDEEFAASADILFSANVPRVFQAEDAAAAASRVCLAIAKQKCEPCTGCGLCDAGIEK